MAERRMMSKKITDTDAFLEMPLSSQALYLHYIQNADDDGFVGNPISIMRKIGANKNDYDLLIAKRFVIVFESGICVIKHWRIHNYIQNDRYTPTTYIDEKSMLKLEENKSYTLNVSNLDTQISIDKNRLVKDSVNEDIYIEAPDEPDKPIKHKHGEYKHVLLTDKELAKLVEDFGQDIIDKSIKKLDEAIEEKGYKYKSHNLTLRRWVIDAVKKEQNNSKSNNMWDNMSEVFGG